MSKKSMQEIVRAGYNQGDYNGRYRNRFSLNSFESLFFNILLDMLDHGSEVLDLGSGTGIPYDLHLVRNGIAVTGIDLSEKHIAMSSSYVPSAKYILGDFLDYHFKDEEFDAVIALYSMFHTPREKHAHIISETARILKPHGNLLITVGTEDVEYKERDNFCGSTMAWSYFDTQTYLNIISESGFKVVEALNEKDYGSTEQHMWILATKAV